MITRPFPHRNSSTDRPAFPGGRWLASTGRCLVVSGGLFVGLDGQTAEPPANQPKQKPAKTGQHQILTPEQAANRSGETCTVRFRVESTARVTDITDGGQSRPHELLLLDRRNGEEPVTPRERSTVVVSVPSSALPVFGVRTLDELARRYEGQTVTVTGRIEVEPGAVRSDAEGGRRPRVRITITEPGRIRVTSAR